MPAVLTDYRLSARNISATSENRIHDDAEARRYGFPGALVPGVAVYAYATVPVLAALGPAWLERGTATVRFVKPVMHGEEVVAAARWVEAAGRQPTVEVRVRNARGQECAVTRASLAGGEPEPPDPGAWPRAPLPAQRPPASREALAEGRVLGTAAEVYDEGCAAEFLAGIQAPEPIYRGAGGRVHPAWYLRQANRALTQNVLVSPWIHLASAVEHLGPAGVGERLEARARVAALFERKGRDLVELDVLLLAGEEARPVAQVRHTAIWRLPAPAS